MPIKKENFSNPDLHQTPEKPDDEDMSLLESIHKKDKRSIKEWMDDAKAGKQMRIC